MCVSLGSPRSLENGLLVDRLESTRNPFEGSRG